MKTQSKQELHQTAFNNSSDVDFKDFRNLYKNCTAKLYSLPVINATHASDKPSRFKNNLLERI